jgi:hypothetical protein
MRGGFKKIRAIFAIMFFGGGSLFCALTGYQAWPFLSYKMYSELKRQRDIDLYVPFGILENGEKIALIEQSYFAPLGLSRISRMVRDAVGRGDAGNQRMQLLGPALYKIYSQRKTKGLHQGPAIRGLEIRQVFWENRSYATNFDQPTRSDFVRGWEFSHD